MKCAFGLISSTLMAFSSVACSGAGDDGTPANNTCGAAITAAPANNYSFSSTLSFPPVDVKPDSELTFDWSAVTTDFLGHPVDATADIDTVNLMLWKLTNDELQVRLNADNLQQRDLAVIATYYNDTTPGTTASAFEFTSVGTPLSPCEILPFLQASNPDPNAHPECEGWAANAGSGWDPAENTYTVMIATGDKLGAGTRMIQAFRLNPASTNTEVVLKSDSTHLTYSVNMQDLEKTPAPTGTGALSIDWTTMTVNSLGNPFVPSDITEALVAHYMQPVSELEANFLDLDIIPADRWRGTIDAGSAVNLSTFTDESGQPFTGIDDTGTWVLALSCGDCRNPAPWYLTILEPCSP